jgi:hypothetical protein
VNNSVCVLLMMCLDKLRYFHCKSDYSTERRPDDVVLLGGGGQESFKYVMRRSSVVRLVFHLLLVKILPYAPKVRIHFHCGGPEICSALATDGSSPSPLAVREGRL